MRKKSWLAGAMAAGAIVGIASAAFAVTTANGPTLGALCEPGDASGDPLPVTVSAGGFTPGASVFIEQCDGLPATDPSWDATTDCDLGTAPAPLLADSTGSVTFLASDPSHKFTPFKGAGPQQLFTCLAPHDQRLGIPGVPDWHNCAIRISTNNTSATGDQVFLPITLPDGPAAPGQGGFAGKCTGSKSLVAVTSATANVGITDQSQPITFSGKLLTDLSSNAVLGGTCTKLVDSDYAAKHAASTPPTAVNLTVASMQFKVSGFASCASNAAATGVDATASGRYPLSGVLKMVFVQTYNSPGGPLPYSLSANVVLTQDLDNSLIWNVSGTVTKGLSVGSTVGGSLRLDPANKLGSTPTKITSTAGPALSAPFPAGYTGYAVDLIGGHPRGCDDANPNNTVSLANTTPPFSTAQQTGVRNYIATTGNGATGLTFTQ